jgi:hypothetical protein
LLLLYEEEEEEEEKKKKRSLLATPPRSVQKHSLLKPFQIRKSSQFSKNSTSQTPDTNYTKIKKDKKKHTHTHTHTQKQNKSINKIPAQKFLFLSNSQPSKFARRQISVEASKQAKTKSTIIVPRPVFPNPA